MNRRSWVLKCSVDFQKLFPIPRWWGNRRSPCDFKTTVSFLHFASHVKIDLLDNGMRFLLLADWRTGSTLLKRTLDMHPDISLAPEPLQWENRPPPKDVHADYSEYLEGVWKQHNGFKIMRTGQISYNNPTWSYLRQQDIKVISLARLNKFEQYISQKLATESQTWEIWNGDQEKKRELDQVRFSIYVPNMLHTIDEWEQREKEMVVWFHHLPMLHITYEELNHRFTETLARVQNFLGVKQLVLKPPLIKMNTIPARRRITNYGNVITTLAQSDKRRYLKSPKRMRQLVHYVGDKVLEALSVPPVELPDVDSFDKCAFTIMSNYHIAESLATIRSMQRFGDGCDYWILCCDDTLPPEHVRKKIRGMNNIRVASVQDIFEKPSLVQDLVLKSDDIDCLRWRLKPYCLKEFLKVGYKRIIYVDNDIYFVKPFDFLFDDLSENGMLLTPHWRALHPLEGIEEIVGFRNQLEDGYFNAGFIGVSEKGHAPLDYWIDACGWRCEKDRKTHLFVDQKYLDYVPLAFPDACKVVEHKGCNVACWNRHRNEREDRNGEIFIDGKWPVIFTHLSGWKEDGYMVRFAKEFQADVTAWKGRLRHIQGH